MPVYVLVSFHQLLAESSVAMQTDFLILSNNCFVRWMS